MIFSLFRKKPKFGDISVTEFEILMDKYISLAQCSKDKIDTQTKEYLCTVIQMRGIPAPDAYGEQPEEIEEEAPPVDLAVVRQDRRYFIPRRS